MNWATRVQHEIEAAGYVFQRSAELGCWGCYDSKAMVDNCTIAEDATLGDCIYKAAQVLGVE